MVDLDVDAATPLKGLILTMDPSLSVYVDGELPTAGLGSEFMTIETNGGVQSNASQRGSAECVLMCSLYVALTSTGATNKIREKILLDRIKPLFARPAFSGNLSFRLKKDPIVYSGKDVMQGYSTKIFNIESSIY